MQRRKFIRNAATAAVAVPGFINGLSFRSYGEGGVLSQLGNSVVDNDHVLVVIQMAGGNDGINMVIPLDQYGNYLSARPNIAIAQANVLALTGTSATGLHPVMTGMRDMYNDGKLCIVQAAGYPTPNFSHFRATDIWMTASHQNEVLTNGWLGRYLNLEYPGYPNGYPNLNAPDPLAIQFGSSTSLELLGPNSQMAVTISNPNNIINGVADVENPAPLTPAGDKLVYVRNISRQANQYSVRISNSYNAGNTTGTIYPNTTLANQLKVVAKMIHGGLKTKIFVCNFGGFDTHSGQVNLIDTSTGTHANLLKQLSDAIKAFHTDLVVMGKDQRVVGMTFSEFGRRIKSNASGGTDHGAAAPMFLFGSQITGGIIGTNPTIPSNPTTGANVPYQSDFRDIYTSLLKRWLCQDDLSITEIMLRTFPQVTVCNDAECQPGPRAEKEESLVRNYPNPVEGQTTVEFKTEGGHTLLQLIGPNGRIISTILEKTYDRPTTATTKVNLTGMQRGMYYLRFQNGSKTQMRPIVKIN
ncbi:MAG: DUF1501 domain-containing protein [Chitinophagaceae bacterium]